MSDSPEDTDEIGDRDLEYTEIVEALVRDLHLPDPGDDRFRIFDDIAYFAEQLFREGLSEELRSGLRDETKAELMACPAAPILLAYFVNSLQRFNATNGSYLKDPKTPSSLKQKTLAHSFGLVGKSGERYEPVDKRMGYAMWFVRAYAKALAQEHARSGEEGLQAEQRALNNTLKEAFRNVYGEDYCNTDDTHKSRMKVLRERVADIPSLIGRGDFL